MFKRNRIELKDTQSDPQSDPQPPKRPDLLGLDEIEVPKGRFKIKIESVDSSQYGQFTISCRWDYSVWDLNNPKYLEIDPPPRQSIENRIPNWRNYGYTTAQAAKEAAERRCRLVISVEGQKLEYLYS